MRNLILYNNNLTDFIDKMSGDFFDCNTNVFDAKTDVIENENEFVLKLDVPGYKENNLKVEVKDNTLKISGIIEKEENKEDKKEKYIMRERYLGEFKRSFSLPENVDSENIDAKLDNGILALTIKKKEETKPVEIKIK